MKKFTIILLLLVSLPIFAQNRKLEQVDENLYSYKLYDVNGQVQQRGYYLNMDGKFFEHGIWKDSYGTTAEFELGKLVWIKPKGQRKYHSNEIQLHQLKRKVSILEQKLASR